MKHYVNRYGKAKDRDSGCSFSNVGATLFICNLRKLRLSVISNDRRSTLRIFLTNLFLPFQPPFVARTAEEFRPNSTAPARESGSLKLPSASRTSRPAAFRPEMHWRSLHHPLHPPGTPAFRTEGTEYLRRGSAFVSAFVRRDDRLATRTILMNILHERGIIEIAHELSKIAYRNIDALPLVPSAVASMLINPSSAIWVFYVQPKFFFTALRY